MKTKQLTLCALFTVLYVITSKIVIPIGIIPITLQTLTVILAGVLLQPKLIFISYGLFLIMGLIGLPVFASGGGISYVLQPSFGFLLSFPVAASVISICKRVFHLQHVYSLFPFAMIALCIIYLIGCTYMYGILNFYMGTQKDFSTILSMGAIPFLLSDTISIALGCLCGLRLQHIPLLQYTHSCI